MRIVQHAWPKSSLSQVNDEPAIDNKIQLVLAFGSRYALIESNVYSRLRACYPQAQILIGSSAGEILGTTVSDDSVCITAIEFAKSTVKAASVQLTDTLDRHEAGKLLAQSLQDEFLAMVIVIADGQNVNGSQLVDGLNAVFKGAVPVVGGLAGDGPNFQTTLVGLNDVPASGIIAAVGIYGSDLSIGFGSQGGWEPFGPERTVTASEGNVLHRLDGKSALELYKLYLGDMAKELPAAGLRFPLRIKLPGSENVSVRTLLAIDESQSSMTFAGDIPVGSMVRLMKSSFDRLISGATEAAIECKDQVGNRAELAILISCVGRKLILNQRIEEEVEEVAEQLPDAAICGFYSYGELSPSSPTGFCELHNQTMTVTTIFER